MDDIIENFLASLQAHIPSEEDEKCEGEEEIFQEQVETINFINHLNLTNMGTDA